MPVAVSPSTWATSGVSWVRSKWEGDCKSQPCCCPCRAYPHQQHQSAVPSLCVCVCGGYSGSSSCFIIVVIIMVICCHSWEPQSLSWLRKQSQPLLTLASRAALALVIPFCP